VQRGEAPRGAGPRCRGALVGAVLLLVGDSAPAANLDFEDAAVGSDSASIVTPGVTIDGGLVLDEALVEVLLGYPASGTWNTTPGGAQGLLNTLAGVITLTFSTPVSFLQLDVLALPDLAGDPGSVLLVGTDGSTSASAVLEPSGSGTGDSGLPEATLAIGGLAFTSATLCPHDLANPGRCLDPAEPTTFWLDEVRFEPIPEPATAVLLGLTLAALALQRRTA
jgi:hypothetical protein